jgi:hypothetical protein
MRSILTAAVATIALLASPAQAGYVGLVGDDAGGIIPGLPASSP